MEQNWRTRLFRRGPVRANSANFYFLEALEPQLAKLGALAEWAFHQDAPTSLGKLRQFATNGITKGDVMLKRNAWTHGNRHFEMSGSMAGMLGRHGVSIHKAVFDADIGEEIYALYMEEPPYAEAVGQVAPFNIFAQNGAIRTPHGIVAFILWTIAAGAPEEVQVEQFLNPANMDALRLLSAAGNQTHFKLVVCDNKSGEVAAFVDSTNAFGFDEFAATLVKLIGHEPSGEFPAAVDYVKRTKTTADLFAMASISDNRAL